VAAARNARWLLLIAILAVALAQCRSEVTLPGGLTTVTIRFQFAASGPLGSPYQGYGSFTFIWVGAMEGIVAGNPDTSAGLTQATQTMTVPTSDLYVSNPPGLVTFPTFPSQPSPPAPPIELYAGNWSFALNVTGGPNHDPVVNLAQCVFEEIRYGVNTIVTFVASTTGQITCHPPSQSAQN
jgi:hypothetical protein